MRLRIPADQLMKLKVALAEAGDQEIGGQIFGEQLAPSDFLASDITIQKRRGTLARFIVDLLQAARDATRFFDRTGRRYARYNYVGEWHSHPSFEVRPSARDSETMRELVEDAGFRGNFAVLMIVRLDPEDIALGAWVFDPVRREVPIALEIMQ